MVMEFLEDLLLGIALASGLVFAVWYYFNRKNRVEKK